MMRRYTNSAGRTLFVSALLVIAGVFNTQAQDFFAAPRDFVVDRVCNATRAIRSQADPVPLDVGGTYPARGGNRSGNPTHILIRVGEADKWVALDCGHFADGASPSPGAASHTHPSGDRECLPFFDTADNPESVGFGGRVDITPKPPEGDWQLRCSTRQETFPHNRARHFMRMKWRALHRREAKGPARLAAAWSSVLMACSALGLRILSPRLNALGAERTAVNTLPLFAREFAGATPLRTVACPFFLKRPGIAVSYHFSCRWVVSDIVAIRARLNGSGCHCQHPKSRKRRGPEAQANLG